MLKAGSLRILLRMNEVAKLLRRVSLEISEPTAFQASPGYPRAVIRSHYSPTGPSRHRSRDITSGLPSRLTPALLSHTRSAFGYASAATSRRQMRVTGCATASLAVEEELRKWRRSAGRPRPRGRTDRVHHPITTILNLVSMYVCSARSDTWPSDVEGSRISFTRAFCPAALRGHPGQPAPAVEPDRRRRPPRHRLEASAAPHRRHRRHGVQA